MIEIQEGPIYQPGELLAARNEGAVFRIPETAAGLTGRLIWRDIFMIGAWHEVDTAAGSRYDVDSEHGTLTLYLRDEMNPERANYWVSDPPSGSNRVGLQPDGDVHQVGGVMQRRFAGDGAVAWKAARLGDAGNGVLLLAEAPDQAAEATKRLLDAVVDSVELVVPGTVPGEAQARVERPDPLLWSHCYAFLFLAAAHGPDAELSQPEAEAIADELGDWWGRPSAEDFNRVVNEAWGWYMSAHPTDATLADEFNFIMRLIDGDEWFDQPRREQLLASIGHILVADGRTLPQEANFYATFQRALGLG